MKTFTKFRVMFDIEIDHGDLQQHGITDNSLNWSVFREAHARVPFDATDVRIETLRTFQRKEESDKKVQEAIAHAMGTAEPPAVSDTEQPKAPLTDISF